MLLCGCINVHGGDGLEEWNEQRIIHQFVENSTSLVQLCGVGRRRAARETEQLIANASREVDLSRSTRDDVNLHKLFP